MEGAYTLFGNLHDRLAEGANVATTALWAQDNLLAELGVEAHLDNCLNCGSTEIRGFSAREGGMLCAGCYSGTGFAVPAPVLQGLLQLRATRADSPLPVLDRLVVREIGRIFKQQLQYHLGLPDRVFRPVLPGGREQ
jgi:recombinational DNA repair protein (RecF pathway)